MYKISTLLVDDLQQQRTAPGSTPVSQEQESDAITDIDYQNVYKKVGNAGNLMWSSALLETNIIQYIHILGKIDRLFKNKILRLNSYKIIR